MEHKNIVVWGESGEGKSTLINNLVGKKVAAVGNAPRGVTKDLKSYESPVGTLWDLPGAGDKDVPPYMALQWLDAAFSGDKKIDGVLLLTANPRRVHLGAEIVIKLMDLSFSSDDKWSSIVLVGTFTDTWAPGLEENFRTEVLKCFNEDVNGSISQVACINKDDFAEVEALIEGLTGGMGDFSMPDAHAIADVVVKASGIKPEDVPKATQEIIDALQQSNARLTEALVELKEKGGSTENFKGLHVGPLGKIGFSW